MVFRSSCGSLPEAASFNNTGSVVVDAGAAMASGSGSSRSLHNFTLPDNLKWSFNFSRFRKPVVADSQRSDEEASSEERTSNKILLRLMSNKSKPDDGEAEQDLVVGDGSISKTWNLRPRRPLVKKQPNADVPKVKQSQGQSLEMGRNGKKKKNKKEKKKDEKEKEGKQRLYVSLSRQEIEDDIFAMTGSKPSRRPKKRTKAVQKLLDNLSPGLWSYTISPDAYRVPDPPLKN